MKYVEQAKSFVLLFLVLLSLWLTLTIWNYKPDYQIIEETPVDEVTIGDEKQLRDVLKPYRLLFRGNDEFKGTVSTSALDDIYKQLATLEAESVELINSNLSDEKLNEMLRVNNRLTMFFSAEVPMQLFPAVVNFKETELPGISFDRLILDWGNVEKSKNLQLLFVNSDTRKLYRSYMKLSNVRQFTETVLQPIENYNLYMEIERTGLQSLYVVKDSIESVQYTYFIDEISPDLFKNVLFPKPSIVERNVESIQSEKFTDGTSLMTVDSQNRILNYVYPAAESIEPIEASKLLRDSFNYLNDHGGITADYRFASMNLGKHVVDYQLYLQGFPVHSSLTTTRITTTWGDNRIFRYRRPYYALNYDVTNEKTIKELPSGEEIIAYIQNSEDIPFDNVEEVVVGYYLIQNQNLGFFTLEPNWFVVVDNVWTRVTTEREGEKAHGLE